VIKVEASKKALETGRKTVSEVIYNVGYNDTKAFRDVFKKVVEVNPLEYRSRYNREVGWAKTKLKPLPYDLVCD
jgi:AraC-like DNA-binding protein